MADNASPLTLPFQTMIHMITVRLNATNSLLWHKHVTSLLHNQNLYHILDGSSAPPMQFLQQTFAIATSPGLRLGFPILNPRFTK